MNGRNEREYDRINNEGGEGYNPYRAKRERQELEAEAAYYRTREGRKERLERMIERKDCSLARECGTYDQAEIDDLRAQLRAIEAEEAEEFLAAWPVDVTKSRRIAWNDRVKSGEFGKPGTHSPDMHRKVYAAEQAQGWTFAQLKKAIKLHNL